MTLTRLLGFITKKRNVFCVFLLYLVNDWSYLHSNFIIIIIISFIFLLRVALNNESKVENAISIFFHSMDINVLMFLDDPNFFTQEAYLIIDFFNIFVCKLEIFLMT